MNTKNLMSQVVKSVNRFNIQDLPIDLVELSERDIQYISGGSVPTYCACGRVRDCTSPRPTGGGLNGTRPTTTTTFPNTSTVMPAPCNCQTLTFSLTLSVPTLRFDSVFGKY